MSEAERLAVGIAFQISDVGKAFGKGEGFGVGMAVLNEWIHRTRLYKVVGERRKKKEANRAVRLARMTLGQLSLKAVQRGAT